MLLYCWTDLQTGPGVFEQAMFLAERDGFRKSCEFWYLAARMESRRLPPESYFADFQAKNTQLFQRDMIMGKGDNRQKNDKKNKKVKKDAKKPGTPSIIKKP